MKTAFLLFFFLIIAFSLKSYGALPPTTLSGMNDTTKTTTFNFKVPNKQATKVTGGTLIETGNPNRLKNPGFEATPIGEGWTTGCTGTATISMGGSLLKYEGKQVMEFSVIGGASGGMCAIYQNADTVSVDGVVAIAIHSENASGVKVLKKINEFDVALEKEIVGKSTWQALEFPGQLGSSKTGVSVEVTAGASETKAVALDEAKVAIANTKQVVGVVTDWQSFTPTGSWTNVTYTGRWRRVGDSVELEIRGDLTGTPTGNLILDYPSFAFPNTTKRSFGVTQVGNLSLRDSDASRDYIATLRMGASNMLGLYGRTDTDPSDVVGAGVTAVAPFTQASGDFFIALVSYPVLGWSATTEVYSTEADFFSTDTNTLTFKGTAITDSDPVGTFNTYSYAINSNTKTICASAPTQTIASMKTNGIQIFTRPYNAASTCGNPARVEVKLGKGMEVVQTLLYKNTGKDIAGSLNFFVSGSTEIGARFNSYNDKTGVLIVDPGYALSSTTTSILEFPDPSTTTSGYLVINAQPKKTTAVADFKEFDYVYVEANVTGATSIFNASPFIFNTEVSDSHNSYNPTTGVFTAPFRSIYEVCPQVVSSGNLSVTERVGMNLVKNGTSFRVAGRVNGTGGSTGYLMTSCLKVPLLKDETLSFEAYSNQSVSVNTQATNTFLTITRIPGQF